MWFRLAVCRWLSPIGPPAGRSRPSRAGIRHFLLFFYSFNSAAGDLAEKTMLININCAKCIGIEAVPVTVEVCITNGIGVHLVGLADVAVKESMLRTMTALKSLGYHIPGKKIVINLAPADMHKQGSGYDLPIALGIIAASGQGDLAHLGEYVIMGELGLDGSVREIPGAMPMAELSMANGLKGCIMPESSARSVFGMDNVKIYGVRTLDDAVRILSGDVPTAPGPNVFYFSDRDAESNETGETDASRPSDIMDFSEIAGQDAAKRGLAIAAAGGHNVIMLGSPGSGKSSLAKALTAILPPLTVKEAVETSKIYSVAGLPQYHHFSRLRPFRSPHHSASIAAIIGGGNGDNISPGEVSLAHNGVLFLDEFTQLTKPVTEALRAPLEDRKVSISRLRSKVGFPASFMLVAAANPCPCGYYGEGERCTCTMSQRLAYFSKLSGPILDRIDIQLWVSKVDTRSIASSSHGETSAQIAERVARARQMQEDRFKGTINTNAEMNNRQLFRYCRLAPPVKSLLEKMSVNADLSARSYTRIWKVARTIADYEGEEKIGEAHILEAFGYRFLDKNFHR